MHRAAIREDGGGFSASSFSLEAVCPDYAIFLIKTCLQHHLSPRICLTTAGLQATGRLQPAIWEVCSLGVRSCLTQGCNRPSGMSKSSLNYCKSQTQRSVTSRAAGLVGAELRHWAAWALGGDCRGSGMIAEPCSSSPLQPAPCQEAERCPHRALPCPIDAHRPVSLC